jgi:hypothetical protein
MFLELFSCTSFPFHQVFKSSSGSSPTTCELTKTGPAGVQLSKALEKMKFILPRTFPLNITSISIVETKSLGGERCVQVSNVRAWRVVTSDCEANDFLLPLFYTDIFEWPRTGLEDQFALVIKTLLPNFVDSDEFGERLRN